MDNELRQQEEIEGKLKMIAMEGKKADQEEDLMRKITESMQNEFEKNQSSLFEKVSPVLCSIDLLDPSATRSGQPSLILSLHALTYLFAYLRKCFYKKRKRLSDRRSRWRRKD